MVSYRSEEYNGSGWSFVTYRTRKHLRFRWSIGCQYPLHDRTSSWHEGHGSFVSCCLNCRDGCERRVVWTVCGGDNSSTSLNGSAILVFRVSASATSSPPSPTLTPADTFPPHLTQSYSSCLVPTHIFPPGTCLQCSLCFLKVNWRRLNIYTATLTVVTCLHRCILIH